jgi:glyoxylase-like metal-dependent hydrolase (beta-lactamase superfamily II)/rhodanese-related sulfurtransferase
MFQHREIPEISPEELVRTIESGGRIRILDIRAPQALAGGRIELGTPEQFLNMRGSEVMSMGEGIRSTLDPDMPLAVVCGHGNSSKELALYLTGLGYEARSMVGGMAAWGDALVPRNLTPPPGFDHLIQFDRISKGALGYLLVADGEAMIVDPPRKPQAFFDVARDLGVKVVAVADTHAHADYISGGPLIAKRMNIPYYLHAKDAILPYDGSPATITFTAIEDGQTLKVGSREIVVEHTPGHTEGSVCYRIADNAVLTGDLIFIRSVGRPDLGGKLDEWTPILWRSVSRSLQSWSPEIRVLPAHYASDAERESDRTVCRPLARVREGNEPLRIISSEADFVGWVKKKVGSSPEQYRKIKAINLGLLKVWDIEAQELESGKNECALG